MRISPAASALVLTAAVVAATGAGPASSAASGGGSGTGSGRAGGSNGSAAALDGVPDGAPPAARAAEPGLPAAAGWPFSQTGFPRTSGTGRLQGGASYWSDYVYDDHGATSASGLNAPSGGNLVPPQGVYTYPDGPAHGNGADIFRTGVGLDAQSSYWRVDWTTLADPDVPIVAWAFDRDADPTTGVSQWPAGAGVSSPGIDTALVVSSRQARLVDLASGGWTDVSAVGGNLSVDRAARSFVVRVPRSVLPVDGSWTVRVAAGLADAAGTGFAEPQTSSGLPAPPGSARVYNVGFRGVHQEPPVYTDGMTDALVAAFQKAAADTPPFDQVGADGFGRFVTGNNWSEDHQADALAQGDVSAFADTVDWSRLASGADTPEPRPVGYSNRWYVTDHVLGQGVVADDSTGGDLRPNFVGPIQPYAVYVPRDVPADQPMPLTWVLHSLGMNHNQYGALSPELLQQLCENRDSVCATTMGRGPDGWYFDEAEADYWAVWRELAQAFPLQPRQTVIGGYSMGGYAAYKLGLQHPDLYAEAVSLAGPPVCGISVSPDEGSTSYDNVRCQKDGATGPLVGNARWVPYRIGQGFADELVPFPSVEQQVQHFDDQGLRYRFVRYPGEDHILFSGQDRFDAVVDGLGHPTAPSNPGQVDYTWYPHLDRPDLGLRATGAYWVTAVQARNSDAGQLAAVHAQSYGVPDPSHTVTRTGPTPVTEPLPGTLSTLEWKLGEQPAAERRLDLTLRNVDEVAVDMDRAGLPCGTVQVSSDGPASVVLRQLPGGVHTERVGAGESTISLPCG